ncbi:MAG: carboxypeptidase regulatory-like domain-containing protein [Sedimentisphaerales bacterium]|nr:carboxypeptidase regulatory-like domain-containing protein [Sedimentisphaerales bacterium]
MTWSEDLPVGLVAGTAEHPRLVEIESIRFEKAYANAWRVTARVGWLPVVDTTWSIAVELLDSQGRVLRHPRDEETAFTAKATGTEQTAMHYVELDLDVMQDQGRRHAVRFRVRLEPLSAPPGTKPRTLGVLVRRQGEPVPEATVVAHGSYGLDAYQRHIALYVTNSQGRCDVKLDANDVFSSLSVQVQAPGLASMTKSWSNSGPSPVGRLPLVDLPTRHVFDMLPTSAVGGIVQDTDGNPIGMAEVYLYVTRPFYVNRCVRSDPNGRWRVEGVPAEVERISLGLRHPDYGGDHGTGRTLVGEAILNAKALKHVETLKKGITLAGTVRDEDGQPVAGVTVLLAQRSDRPFYAISDAAGAFRLVASPDRDTYGNVPTVIVEAPGYAPAYQVIDIEPNPAPLEFLLTRGKTLTCRVVDSEGKPVADAWTVVQPFVDYRDYDVWLEDTDAQGVFKVPHVPASDIALTVGKSGFITVRDYAVVPTRDEFTIPMKRAMTLEGTVTDAQTGYPIPNFEIATARNLGGRPRADRPAAFSDGTYELRFDESSSAPLQLHVSAVGYEQAVSEEFTIDEGRREFNFQLARGSDFKEETAGQPRPPDREPGVHRIRGVVRDAQGRPVSGATVSLRPALAREVVTGDDGTFVFRFGGGGSVYGPGGRDELVFVVARHTERNLAAAVQIDPASDKVDINLDPGVVFYGRVVDADGKGIPEAQMSLTLWISNTGYGSREPVQTSSDGSFEIKAVPRGFLYSVQAQAEGYGLRYVRVDPANAADRRVELEPLVLEVANLLTGGIVVNAFDQPVANIRVYAYGNGQPTREVYTDSEGKFTLENMCKGTINFQANAIEPKRLHGRARAEGGDTDIKIVINELDPSGRVVPSQPPSLLGKRLPAFENVALDLAREQLQDKRLLICFWDMNQRPSRNGLTQLVGKARELEGKGITVVTIQTSPVERAALDNWLKEQNVPFPAGMIEADEQKTRLTWGVRSLPWLILTDREHLVTAEGIALDELDAAIESNR